MLSRFGAVVLALGSLWAALPVAANPILILDEQCHALDYAQKLATEFDATTLSTQDAPALARRFEQLTLGLNNLSDQLGVYMAMPLAQEARKRLVNCQIRLADEIDAMVALPSYRALAEKLSAAAPDEDHEIRRLGELLSIVAKDQLPPMQKARLHSAEAAFISSRKRVGMVLHTSDQCQLPSPVQTSTQTPATVPAQAAIETQVAAYLRQQTDEHCREQVWKAYQQRQSDTAAASLRLIHTVRQQQASSIGTDSFAHYQLQQGFLGSIANAEQFLQLTKPAKSPAPWNIGAVLTASKSDRPDLQTDWLLKSLIEESRAFGIEVEYLSEFHLRFWLKGRLLGELVWGKEGHQGVTVARRSVFTRQFAQLNLILPDILHGRSQANRAIGYYADALAMLVSNDRFYLLSRKPWPADLAQLPSNWLAEAFEARLASELPPLEPSEAIAEQYSLSQAYYQASLAIDFFKATPAKTSRFVDYFDGDWADTTAQYQSATTPVLDGPLLYRHLLCEQLAGYLLRHSDMDDRDIFALLVENRAQQPLLSRLWTVLGAQHDAQTLIALLASAGAQR